MSPSLLNGYDYDRRPVPRLARRRPGFNHAEAILQRELGRGYDR